MNNSQSEIVSFLAQEAEKNIKGMLEHGLFRNAGISTADVIAAIVCKPGYDTVKNRVIADIEPGVYDDKLLVMWTTDDVIRRANDYHVVHFSEDAALMVLDWLDSHFDGDIGVNWDWIDNGIDVVLEELVIEEEGEVAIAKAITKGGCDE